MKIDKKKRRAKRGKEIKVKIRERMMTEGSEV